jgi:hypothetical protein
MKHFTLMQVVTHNLAITAVTPTLYIVLLNAADK